MTPPFRLLGPLEVRAPGGSTVDVGGRQPRVVLGLLLAARGRPVAVEALIDALWGETPPASAAGTLQSYVSRLRRHLAPFDGVALTHEEAGYRLTVPRGGVDVDRFEALVAEAAGSPPAAARRLLAEADALWRGPAFVDLLDVPWAAAAAVRLEEQRLVAAEARIDAELASGRAAEAAAELAGLVADHPLREGFAARLALALYRSGRQADALRVLTDAAALLRRELGVGPGPVLRDLEAAILRHDPALDGPAAAATAPGEPVEEVAVGGAPAAPPAVEHTETGIVGRDEEFAALLAAFDEAAGDHRFVVLEGEPGIGKTRLAEALRAIAVARGARTAWGRSDEGGAAPALWPWLVPLRTAAAHVGGDPGALADLLDGGDGPAAEPLLTGQGGARRFERFEAAAALLEAPAPPAHRSSSCSTTSSGPTPRPWSCSPTWPGARAGGCSSSRPCGRWRWAGSTPSPTPSPPSPAGPAAAASSCGAWGPRPPPSCCGRPPAGASTARPSPPSTGAPRAIRSTPSSWPVSPARRAASPSTCPGASAT